MGKTQQAAGGGLTAADRAKLIPANLRKGIVLFEGTAKEVVGTADIMPDVAYISSLGVSCRAGSATLGGSDSATAATVYAESTPVFDITAYDYAGFMGCSTSFRDTHITVSAMRCEVVQNNTVVASVSGIDRAIDVSGLTGYVSFRFTGYFVCRATSTHQPASISFSDIYLERKG